MEIDVGHVAEVLCLRQRNNDIEKINQELLRATLSPIVWCSKLIWWLVKRISPTKIRAIWLDQPKHIELVPRIGSISSKQVNKVFVAQVQLSTSRCHQVLLSTLLDSRSNSCFLDLDFSALQQILLYKLPSPSFVVVIDELWHSERFSNKLLSHRTAWLIEMLRYQAQLVY